MTPDSAYRLHPNEDGHLLVAEALHRAARDLDHLLDDDASPEVRRLVGELHARARAHSGRANELRRELFGPQPAPLAGGIEDLITEGTVAA